MEGLVNAFSISAHPVCLVLNEYTHGEIQSKGSCRVFLNRKNIGLSRAYNLSLSYFAAKSIDYMLILDDDTRVETSSGELWEALDKGVNTLRSSEGVAALWLDGSSSGGIGEEVDFFLNAGLLAIVPQCLRVGGFDERFFVELVDYSFSIRLKMAGLRVLRFGVGSHFDHISGQSTPVPVVLGRPLYFLREYPYRRIREIFISSLRLIFIAVWNYQFLFSFRVLAILIFFIFCRPFALMLRIISRRT